MGERLIWFKIADRLSMSPQEAMRKHTVSEFHDWQTFFELELNEFHRDDYNFARVAYEVYQLRATLSAFLGSQLPHQETKEFIPTFTFSAPPVPFSELSDSEREEIVKEYSNRSRDKYFGILGLDEKGNQIRRGPQPPAEGAPQPQGIPLGPGLPPRESPSHGQTTPPQGQTPTKRKKGNERRIITPGEQNGH